ncbi:hypothetical protein [Nannocystis radixulma]|uniref:Extensin n=1 Tax=Nannocystis radixulma TaxID=2995305 RepID=A0ABT5BEW2_9BACT|nr:hypothetical protein [Nannocystis radixulma]MDC0672612.1 hypothetical protein [Nannocystis radixulma]
MKRAVWLAGCLGLAALALAQSASSTRRPPPSPPPALSKAPSDAPPRHRIATPAQPAIDAPSPVAAPVETDDEFPPPTPEPAIARPEPRLTTPDEQREQKRAAFDLVAHSIERLDRERQAAERAGDHETARLDELRIARLRERGEALAQELAEPASKP